jgi:predicted kinase
MEAVIFIGIQGIGKTTFYKERFFETHIRISMDMLRTRNRETILLHSCIQAKQPFVIDNTNVTIRERAKYIEAAKMGRFNITGYFFKMDVKAALHRNNLRAGKSQVPVAGLLGTVKKLQRPSSAEGFDRLYYVTVGNGFTIEDWRE